MGVIRGWLRQGVRALGLRVFRVTVHVPPALWQQVAQGRAIVCANHVSLLDGVLIALASPVPLVYAVDTDYARRSWPASCGLRSLAWVGLGEVVPLDAGAPFGLRRMAKCLTHGRSVMVFPTGTIAVGAPIRPGLDWLATRTGATQVRLRITGAECSRLFARRGTHWWPRISLHADINPISRL